MSSLLRLRMVSSWLPRIHHGWEYRAKGIEVCKNVYTLEYVSFIFCEYLNKTPTHNSGTIAAMGKKKTLRSVNYHKAITTARQWIDDHHELCVYHCLIHIENDSVSYVYHELCSGKTKKWRCQSSPRGFRRRPGYGPSKAEDSWLNKPWLINMVDTIFNSNHGQH